MNITLCTDLDRTLIPNGLQEKDPQAIPLLHKLTQQKNITLIYVSGRDKKLVLDAISEYELPVPRYAITDVGTRIYSIHSDETPSKTESLSLWKEDQNWKQYLQKGWDEQKLIAVKDQIDAFSYLQLQEPEKQAEFKLSYYLDSEYFESGVEHKVKDICQQQGLNSNLIKSHDETTDTGLLDILPANASKYHAIRFLMDKYTIIEKEILFCGDSGNDMEVLVSELPAVLVNNAQPSVKQLAQQLAEQNHHATQLYIAKGDFCGLNGCYGSGILEGLAFYYPEFEKLICEQLNPSS